MALGAAAKRAKRAKRAKTAAVLEPGARPARSRWPLSSYVFSITATALFLVLAIVVAIATTARRRSAAAMGPPDAAAPSASAGGPSKEAFSADARDATFAALVPSMHEVLLSVPSGRNGGAPGVTSVELTGMMCDGVACGVQTQRQAVAAGALRDPPDSEEYAGLLPEADPARTRKVLALDINRSVLTLTAARVGFTGAAKHVDATVVGNGGRGRGAYAKSPAVSFIGSFGPSLDSQDSQDPRPSASNRWRGDMPARYARALDRLEVWPPRAEGLSNAVVVGWRELLFSDPREAAASDGRAPDAPSLGRDALIAALKSGTAGAGEGAIMSRRLEFAVHGADAVAALDRLRWPPAAAAVEGTTGLAGPAVRAFAAPPKAAGGGAPPKAAGGEAAAAAAAASAGEMIGALGIRAAG